MEEKRGCDARLEGVRLPHDALLLGTEEKGVDVLVGSRALNFHSFYIPDARVSLTPGQLILGKKSFTSI